MSKKISFAYDQFSPGKIHRNGNIFSGFIMGNVGIFFFHSEVIGIQVSHTIFVRYHPGLLQYKIPVESQA